MTTPVLPLPELNEGRFDSLSVFTDEALFDASGVRIAFTTREGGVSSGAYESLNLGLHVQDDPEAVKENRSRLVAALAPDLGKPYEEALLVPNQVHGDTVVIVEDQAAFADCACSAQEGADSIIVEASDVGALLCYADCVPVILVFPNGTFAVVHAGWRGVDNQIAVKTLKIMIERQASCMLLDSHELAAQVNVYIGPYIHAECFEVGEDLVERFTRKFGASVALGACHIDLGEALRVQLVAAGIRSERIADLGLCTVCNNNRFFSYRAQGGVAGRHGAFAIRCS